MPIDVDNIDPIALASHLGGTGEVADPLKINDGGVDTAHLADNAVTTAKVADGAVTTDKLGNAAVETAKIADDAVTEDKIANDAVGPDQLKPTAVTAAFYTNANITVDPDGRISYAENGAAGGGPGFAVISSTRGMLNAAAGSTYVAPASLGDPAVLTIADWASFKSLTVLLEQGLDYDNSNNDFVLEIVDQSGNSNTWDPANGLAGYDLVLPTFRVRDAGPTVLNAKEAASYGIAETPVDNSPSNAVAWDAGTLTLRFGGADMKAKSRNILTLTA